jgi:transposase
MVRRTLTLVEKLQAVGTAHAGFRNRRVTVQIRVHHSVIYRLVERLQEAVMVDWRPRSGRPLKTTPRKDRLIALCARRNHFSTSARNRDDLNFRGNVSVRTANRRRNEEHLHRRLLIKLPPLSLRHRRAWWIWSRDHLRWNIRNWKRLSPLVTLMAAFKSGGIRTLHFMTGTTAFGGGGVTVWGCFSFNCQLDLHVLQGNINGVA